MAIEVLVESFLGNQVVKTRAYDKASRRRTYSLPSSPHHTFRVLSAEPSLLLKTLERRPGVFSLQNEAIYPLTTG
jgi:hypothetical protein